MTQEQNKLTDNDFDAKYTCEYNRVMLRELAQQQDTGSTTIDDMAPFGGCMYETYGEEYARVQQMAAENPKRVWTVISCDGWEGIVAGWHYTNRLGYLITEQEWGSDEEEYTVYDERTVNDWFHTLEADVLSEMFVIPATEIDEDKKDELYEIWSEWDLDRREELMETFKAKD